MTTRDQAVQALLTKENLTELSKAMHEAVIRKASSVRSWEERVAEGEPDPVDQAKVVALLDRARQRLSSLVHVRDLLDILLDEA